MLILGPKMPIYHILGIIRIFLIKGLRFVFFEHQTDKQTELNSLNLPAEPEVQKVAQTKQNLVCSIVLKNLVRKS